MTDKKKPQGQTMSENLDEPLKEAQDGPEAIQEEGRINREFVDGLKSAIDLFSTPEAFKGQAEETINKTAELIKTGSEKIIKYLKSDRYKAIMQNLANFDELTPDLLEAAGDMAEEVKDLLPFIQGAIDRAPDNLEVSRETLPDLLAAIRGEGDPESPWQIVYVEAMAGKETVDAAREAAEALQELPTVTYKNKSGVVLTTDKLMSVFFGANAPAAPKGEIPGQLTFLPVKYEKNGAPEVTLYYTYNFDNDLFAKLKLEKKIDDEDYFILSFIANYWRAGEKEVSVYKLYKDMTGDNPNITQQTELTNRLMKIAGTNIFINDREVRRAWNIEDEKKTYREVMTPLAPIKVGANRFMVRGQVVEAGIQILAEPDIVKLGYEMGQITTIPKNLLHVKKKDGRRLNRTSRFYRVLHFLIRRIAAMKNDNLSAKILYDTFYSETGETTARGRQLARDCLFIILDHFKECDKWITGYREETTPTTGKTGVRIFYTATPKKIGKAKR